MIHEPEYIEEYIGEYHLLSPLGRGSFGIVYLAEHIYEHTQVAVKVLGVSLTWKEFLNEARSFRLQHPHIIQLLDFGVSKENRPFLVMEYAPGGSVREQMDLQNPFPLGTIATLTNQLASALQYAHDRRLIHRDVKPENMLLLNDGTVLLSDFGIASMWDQSRMVSGFTHTGTPAYMAPEQGMGRPCPASDQYALAVTVYEWLTGCLPFTGDAMEVAIQHRLDIPPPPRAFNPAISSQLEQVILRALNKQPEERYPTVIEFARAVEEAITAMECEKVPTQLLAPIAASPVEPLTAHNQPVQEKALPPILVSAHTPQRSLAGEKPAHSRPRPLRQHKKILLLTGILLLVLIGVTSAMILQDWPLQKGSHSTASSIVTPTVAVASATGQRATTTATATATATDQAPAGLTPPAGWIQVLNDPMAASQHDGSWETNDNCAFRGTYYEETSTGLNSCVHGDASVAGSVYGDVFYSIDLSIQEGTQAGLLFRNTDGNYYSFSITTTGGYTLETYQSTNNGHASSFALQPKPSQAIHQGQGQWNTLTVLARGTSLQLYINNVLVTTEADNTFAQGLIGVVVNSLETADVYSDVWFKNASVWIPS